MWCNTDPNVCAQVSRTGATTYKNNIGTKNSISNNAFALSHPTSTYPAFCNNLTATAKYFAKRLTRNICSIKFQETNS